MAKKNKKSANNKVSTKQETKSNWKQTYKEKKSLILYTAFVIGFTIFFLVLTNQAWFETLATPILAGYASISSVILNLFGMGTTTTAENINSGAYSLQIKKGCDAIAPMILYMVSILAFPIAMKWKWKGVIYGIIALAVMNIIRIVSLYFFGRYTSQAVFDIMHVDVWQILFIAFTVFLWLYWMRWAFTKEEAAHATT